MPPRPHWKGHLKLSLVSCPIALYPAVNASDRLSFRQVNKATGNRLRHQLIDSVTGAPVEPKDKGRGYEVRENQFVLVKDEELEAARQEAQTTPYSAARANPPASQSQNRLPKSASASGAAPANEERPALATGVPVRMHNPRTIEIERFVPAAQVDPRYHSTLYYIVPRDEIGQEAFAVIRDAMGKDVVGIGHVVLANRERPILVQPKGNGLLGITLRYAHELRNDAEYFAGIPEFTLPGQMLGLAEHIVAAMTADFDPAYLEDRYRTVLVSMLKEKQSQANPAGPVAPSRSNVIDLIETLKRSLAAQRPSPVVKPRRAAIASKAAVSKRSDRRTR